MADESTLVYTQQVTLDAGSTSGSTKLQAGFTVSHMAVINQTEATLSMSPGRTSSASTTAVPVPPNFNLAFPVETDQVFTLFWSSDSALPSGADVLVLMSNQPVQLQGGPTTTGGVAQAVTVANTPTVNVGTLPPVTVSSAPQTTGSNYDTTSPGTNPIKVDSDGNQYVNFPSTQNVNVENNTQLQNGIIGASQVSVTTTAAQLTIPDNIRSLAIQNTSTTAILYLGASDTVTSTTGYPVQPMQTLTFDIDPTATGLVFWAIGSADLTAAILGVS